MENTKRDKAMKKLLSTVSLGVYVLGLVTYPLPASAIQELPSSPDAVVEKDLKPDATQSCDNVCSMVLTEDGEVEGPLGGDNAWKDGDDDKICAQLGKPTKMGYVVPEEQGTKTHNCQFDINDAQFALFKDKSGDDSLKQCNLAGQAIMRCMYKNSQVYNHCQAYQKTENAMNSNWNLVVLDGAAAAACGLSCANPAIPQLACTAAGGAATAYEWMAVSSLKNETLANAMKVGIGAAGASALWAGMLDIDQGVTKGLQWATDKELALEKGRSADFQKDFQTADQKLKNATDPNFTLEEKRSMLEGNKKDLEDKIQYARKANRENGGAGMDTKAFEDAHRENQAQLDNIDNASRDKDFAAYGQEKSDGIVSRDEALKKDLKAHEEENVKQQKDRDRQFACMAALSFGALAGVRGADILLLENSKKSACESIQALHSKKTKTLAFLAAVKATDSSDDNKSDEGTDGNNKSVSQTGGQNVADTKETKKDKKKKPKKNENEDSEEVQGLSPEYAAASVDGRLLSSSGMDKVALPLAQRMNRTTALQTLKNGGAGALIASFMPAAAGNFGRAVAQVAQAAQQDPSFIGSSSGMSTGKSMMASIQSQSGAEYSSGGSIGTSAASSGGMFGGFFGGNADRAPANGPQSMNFGGPASGPDIWHSGTDKNIFEIVSGKIGTVTPRVK